MRTGLRRPHARGARNGCFFRAARSGQPRAYARASIAGCNRMKTLTLTAILGFALAVNAGADTLTFDSINTSTAPFQLDITTTNYLAQYGITLVNNSPGTTVDVLCANADYNTYCTEGQGAIFAHSGPNVLKQSGNGAESYTLQFSNPLSSLSFYTAGYYGLAPNGLLVAQWSVTAYDGATAVNSVGQPMTGYFVNVAPEQWTDRK